MFNVFLVGLGGFLGAISRYFVGTLIQNNSVKWSFPIATLIVNLVGCLVIGFLAGYLETKNLMTNNIKLFIFVGVLGGFTTFSAFGLETLNLFNKGLILQAFNYVSLSVIFGLGFVWIGHFFSKII